MLDFFKSLGYHIEENCKNIKLDALPKFQIPINTIILFDTIGDFQMNREYEDNYIPICEKIQSSGFNFIFLPCVDFPLESEDMMSYYFPHLSGRVDFTVDYFMHLVRGKEEDDLKYFTSYAKDNKSLLDYLGYEGNIRSGFIIESMSRIYILEYSNEDIEKGLPDPLDKIVEYLEIVEGQQFYSRHKIGDSSNNNRTFEVALEEKLEDETVLKIEEIKRQLEDLKSSGKLLLVLPLLQEKLDSLFQEIDLSLISTISVNEDYEITLPYFNDLEVKMSHLTKVVYVLFYKHPEGIDISNLSLYRDEILRLYLQISHQENYDKIKKTVDDLVNPNNKNIHTHLSRIKSTFYKLMDESYAKNYIVRGMEFGSSFKYIPILMSEDLYKNDDFDIGSQMI